MSNLLVEEVETRLVIQPSKIQTSSLPVPKEAGGLILLDSSADFPVKTKAGQLSSPAELQAVWSQYSDRSQLLLTRTGKTGTVLQIRRDASKQKPNAFVVSVDLLLGVKTEESVLFARLLASGPLQSHLTGGRTCLLGLGLQPDDLADVKQLADSVAAFLS